MQLQRKNASSPPHAIIAMGVSGCGKSTLSIDLAARLACEVLEGDDFHSPASVDKMRAGKPLDDADRWNWLDRLGGAVGAAALRNGVAVASCSALKRCYRERLEAAAGVPLLFILLDATPAAAAARLAVRADHYMPLSLLDSQFATLERPAADERAIALTPYRPMAEMSAESIAWAETEAARIAD